MSRLRNPRTKFRDAVKDHGPDNSDMRFLLLLLADFKVRDDGRLWATDKRLSEQSTLPLGSVREYMLRMDEIWFDRSRNPGKAYRYLLRDPGPGARVRTRDEVRAMARERRRLKELDPTASAADTPPPARVNPTAAAAHPPPHVRRTRRRETYKDYGEDGRPLSEEASDPPALAPGTARCPECKSAHVEGVDCGYCAKSPLKEVPTFDLLHVNLDEELDKAMGGE